jgi:hypothetical protein
MGGICGGLDLISWLATTRFDHGSTSWKKRDLLSTTNGNRPSRCSAGNEAIQSGTQLSDRVAALGRFSAEDRPKSFFRRGVFMRLGAGSWSEAGKLSSRPSSARRSAYRRHALVGPVSPHVCRAAQDQNVSTSCLPEKALTHRLHAGS